MNKADFFKLERKRRKIFQRRYCLHWDAPTNCSKDFISAHTVQRAMIEKYLTESKHVLQFKPEINPDGNAILFKTQRVGHRVATTFNGFCGFHDNNLFKPIEIKRFNFEERQIALLGFRSFSRELYLKDAQIDLNTALKDHMLEDRTLQTLDRLEYLCATQIGLLNASQNLRYAWQLFSDMLNKDSFVDLRFLAVEFSHPPAYFASTGFLPEWDFNGCPIQNLENINVFHGISFSAWAANGNSTAVFCWHSTWDAVCKPFIESLVQADQARWANLILSMAFEYSENVILSPSWWDGLPERERVLLSRRVPSGLNSCNRTSTSLCDDGLCALSPEIVNVVKKFDL